MKHQIGQRARQWKIFWIVSVVTGMITGCADGSTSSPESAVSPPEQVQEVQSNVAACNGCLVGPEWVSRSAGTPITERFVFAADKNAYHVLEVEEDSASNGSGSVILNGVEIVRERDLAGASLFRLRTAFQAQSTNTLSVRLTGTPGYRVRISIFECASPELVVSVGAGISGTPLAGQHTYECGARVSYSYGAASGFQNPRVYVDHEKATTSGSILVTRHTSLSAFVDKVTVLSPQALPVRSAIEALLTAGDKRRAFGALLDALTLLESSVGGDFREQLNAIMREVETDPTKLAALQESERELGGHIVVPNSSAIDLPIGALRTSSKLLAGSQMGGKLTTSRPTLALYINGVLNSRADAYANYVEFAKALKEAGLDRTYAAYSYNPTISVSAFYVDALQCLTHQLSWRTTLLGIPGVVDYLWDVATECGLPEKEIPDLFEALAQIVHLPIQSAYPRNLADDIHEDISLGIQVIAVPHSQGNMMLRDALNRFSTVSATDQKLLTSISLAPQGAPSTSRLAAYDCWMVKWDIFEWLGVDACDSSYSPISTAKSDEITGFFFPQVDRRLEQGCGSGSLLTSCTTYDTSLRFPGEWWLHDFVQSYLSDKSRTKLLAVLKSHKTLLDQVPTGSESSVSDDFGSGLGKWIVRDPDGLGSWSTTSGELLGDYNIGCGATPCKQSQLLLADSYQPKTLNLQNWRMEIQSGLVQAYCCYNGGATVNLAKFVLYVSDTEKETFDVGWGWTGVTAPVSFDQAYVSHQKYPWANIGFASAVVPNWSPAKWQTAILEKSGDTYTVYFKGDSDSRASGAKLLSVIRTFSSTPKVGFNTYGRVRMDNFKLTALP